MRSRGRETAKTTRTSTSKRSGVECRSGVKSTSLLYRRSRRILFSIALLAVFLFTISDTCLHASNHFVNAAANGATARPEQQDQWVAVFLRSIVQLVVSASIAAGTKNWPCGPVRAWPRLLVVVSRRH